MEEKTGVLQEGMLADIVVLSADVSAAAIDDLEHIHPVMTMCDGKITHDQGVAG